jgi:23S rRNA (cytidine1920-2'-O)/16S rRNA (cytidine1409-2'-O)-methyltransferase
LAASPKRRFDECLVDHGLASDRKEAQAMILSGEARYRGQPGKPGDVIGQPGEISVLRRSPWVSRGAEKLLGALEAFGITVKDAVCLDVGASTGGFTQVLLDRGARRVWAVDVGKGLLDQRLRKDARVRVLEGTNFRSVDPGLFSEPPSLATVDVSFISLDKILPKLAQILPSTAQAITLVKPQFEGTPKEAPGGFVPDEKTRRAIVARVAKACVDCGFRVLKQVDASIPGRQGNQETLFLLEKIR